MKDTNDYIRDISEMRAMMERSSRFLSLSGLAGVITGIYALTGAFIAHQFLGFRPQTASVIDLESGQVKTDTVQVLMLALAILFLAVGTGFLLSYRKSGQRKEKFWNPVSRNLLINMLVPLAAGGILAVILMLRGDLGLIAPVTLIFYGLALFNASNFTFKEVRSLGLIEIGLGLIGAWFIEYGLLCWALGFGLIHIIYGIYMHYRYER